jgi:hypothetical protein
MIKALGLACLLLLAWSVEAAARCSVPRIRTLNNQAVDGYMTVSSGARCSIKMRGSSGPTYSASIVQRPSHGSVSVNGYRIIYQSQAGYVGNDAFTYARHGETARGEGAVRTVQVSVRVTR